MDNGRKIETEDEIKKRLRKEIMDELLNEIKEEKETLKEKRELQAEKSEDKIAKESEADVSVKKEVKEKPNPVKEEDSFEKIIKEEASKKGVSKHPKAGSSSKKVNEPDKKTNGFVFVIALLLIAVGVFFFPVIEKKIKQFRLERNQEDIKAPVETPDAGPEKITLESEVLNRFTYPVMRNNRYSATTYYSKESITMSEFSNNDKLYNAFIRVRTGNFEAFEDAYTDIYCGEDDAKRSFKARYIELRMENLFSKNTTFKDANFKVPANYVDPNGNPISGYVGTWRYDNRNNRYIYYGNCDGTINGDNEYYDIKLGHSVSASGAKNNDVSVTYNMAFAKVLISSKKYTIYRDAALKDEIASGVLTTNNYQKELDGIVKGLMENNITLSRYTYTFSTRNCAYGDYCFETGEWVK